jgi:cysteine-rich repeat protein
MTHSKGPRRQRGAGLHAATAAALLIAVGWLRQVGAAEPESGCADRQREGFVDVSSFPAIAGCSGGWSIPGIHTENPGIAPPCGVATFDTTTPACGRAAGDDSANPSGTGCNVADLCEVGWHVCESAADAAAHSPSGCAGATRPDDPLLLFLSRQSGTGCGVCSTGTATGPQCDVGCATGCQQTARSANDIFGCGNFGLTNADFVFQDCGPFNRFLYSPLCDGSPWGCPDQACEAFEVTKRGPSRGGVLCCRDLIDCGDGVLSAGEQCDDGNTISCDGCSSACQTELPPACGDGTLGNGCDQSEECDDGNTLSGDGCSATCKREFCGDGIVTPPEQCDDGNRIDGDGCDSNCRPTGCGNGIVTPPEQCDDGNDDPNDGCTTACTRCGNGTVTTPEQCDDGNLDACDGCGRDCRFETNVCGDGVHDPQCEECDDGNHVNEDACRNDCRFNVCGDGFRNPATEECDNRDGGNRCSSYCTICGNGIVGLGEECDDRNQVNEDACRNDCQFNVCGDGLRNPATEECDDGNRADFDGCTNDCTICGNGILTPPEQCDDGNRLNEDACRDNCLLNVCGDGFRNPAAEQCDDGNRYDYDGCTNACTVCGNGVVTPPEQCDDGNRVNEDACRNDCHPNVCGDGSHNPATEQCDDGNSRDGDGCDSNCTPTACGNGIVSRGEECDDGNLIDGDGCDSNCTPTGCGNGVVTAGEECDDGNGNPFDGCTRQCVRCGNGIVTPPEQCDGDTTDPNESCTSACTICGDGIVAEPEQCDDGNLIDGDGCSPSCTVPGCGNAILEGDEECDDGGVCAGGADEGTYCTGPAECSSGECRAVGGDGCASNCTLEAAHVLTLNSALSSMHIETGVLQIPLVLSGQVTLRLGKPRTSTGSDETPISVRASDVRIAPAQIGGFGCLCLVGEATAALGPGNAGAGAVSCGGPLQGIDITSRIDHDTRDVDPNCAAGTRETSDWGECIDAVCAGSSNSGDPCRGPFDCQHLHDTCVGSQITTGSLGPPGSALLELHLTTRQLAGNCLQPNTNPMICIGGANSGSSCDGHCPGGTCVPAKGPDGVPCTDDDPFPGGAFGQGGFGGGYITLLPIEVQTRFTTGVATAEILDVNAELGARLGAGEDCGGGPCDTVVSGTPFECVGNQPSANLSAVAFAAAFPSLDLEGIGDSVTTLVLAAGPSPTPSATPSSIPTATPISTLTRTATAAPTQTPTATTESGSGGGCTVTTNQGSGGAALLWFSLVLLMVRRSRRRESLRLQPPTGDVEFDRVERLRALVRSRCACWQRLVEPALHLPVEQLLELRRERHVHVGTLRPFPNLAIPRLAVDVSGGRARRMEGDCHGALSGRVLTQMKNFARRDSS